MRFTDKDDSNEYKSKKYGTAWQARQMMRMGRGWFNMAWAMAFPSDPGFSIDKALDHRFFSAKIPATAAKLMAQPQPNAGVDVSEIELQHR